MVSWTRVVAMMIIKRQSNSRYNIKVKPYVFAVESTLKFEKK